MSKALLGAALLAPALGCGAAASRTGAQVAPEQGERYPERKRPEPLRSASDGDVMGAQNQSPEDTLEASPTNLHPAAGWAVEDGKLVPDRERRGVATGAAAPAEPAAGEEDCPPESGRAAATGSGQPGTGKKRRCPPAQPE